MVDGRDEWSTTTHDWARTVDRAHLEAIRADPARFAPGGVSHLILEVMAYAADEAEDNGSGHCAVSLLADGSMVVADDGRGTDTRVDANGVTIKKPVMATMDVRFFDNPAPQRLPDGHPRRGMSVVAALSEWLVHTNRRSNGAWEQRYQRGIPVSELATIAPDGTTGTTVHFMPATNVSGGISDLHVVGDWPSLAVSLVDHRDAPKVPISPVTMVGTVPQR